MRNSKLKQNIGAFAFGLFLLVLVVGGQFFIYWLFAPWAKKAFPENGKYILIGIIAFAFIFMSSAACYGIMNAGNSKNSNPS